ncbi:MAG: FtsX-like permease family protein [Chitinivibrionales bacterium]|nr:FtsX-like permease family protein [Chitinivibrionales bacterium]MBD3397417.1 FtsX-like permease family protein [Chitinivibrionales bacterium]
MEWFIAFRYLRGKRKIGFISLITYISAGGVFLGTLVLVIALSIANGFEKEVRDRIVGTLAHGKILKYHSRPITGYDSLRKEILAHPHVVGAAPYISGKAGIEHDQVQEGVMVMGIDAELESTVTDLDKAVKYGRFRVDSMESVRGRMLPGILIGIGLADKMGVREGSEVVLIGLAPVEGALDPVPKMARYVVCGIFETGMYEYDLNLVYTSLDAARELFNVRGVEGINVRTTDLFAADRITQSVKEHIGGYPYRASDWKSQNRSLFQWMKLEKLVIFIVISLIIVVAAFSIFSSLIMMILEKRREIGILMGMGATAGSIMKIFILNGTVIGFLGSTCGALAGLFLCYLQHRYQLIGLPGDIYFINKLPVLIRPLDVIAVYLSANVLCFVATSYPAWQASRLLPAESIRYE